MPGRILVVDDIPSSRLVVRARLSMAYYDVIEAASGEDALELARKEQPDLILLDIMMPGMNGYETCRQLKNDPKTAHIPVVVLSGLSSREERVLGFEAGADDYLNKPFEDSALLARISGLTRMKMMIDELRLRAETSRELGLEPFAPAGALGAFPDASVLIVSSDEEFGAAAARALRERIHCGVAHARGEAEAKALIRSNDFDAFVIGTELSDGEPMRMASALRGRPDTRQAALMMVFQAEDVAGPALALDMGVPDYLQGPPDLCEMAARLRVQLRRKHYSDQLRDSLQASVVQAVTDPLTGLYNRRYANAHLEQMIQKPRAPQRRLAAMILDLDRFKSVNDGHGHSAGDAVLVEFAERLRRVVRPTDLISRVGGEEFLVVMPDILPEHAETVAERVRHSVESPPFQAGEATLDLTVSIGLALMLEGESSVSLIERADRALYASKAAGRNTVTLAAA
ncbi:MAG: PleD family two-component system response regulator [Pseudomonadota bacterium]